MNFKEKMNQGHQEAISLRLDLAESWTPLLHYIHATRLGCGFVLGLSAIGIPLIIYLLLM